MAAKPLLASEVLRDELAPYEPSRRASRGWAAGIAASLLLLGIALSRGVAVGPLAADAATICFSAAAALLAVALLPFPYAWRAGVMLLIGGVLMLLGLRSAGPLAGLALDGGFEREVARLSALSALPAALIFRSKYRAFRWARGVLAAALLVSLPFAVGTAALLGDASAPLVARAAAAFTLLTYVGSCAGFLGPWASGAAAIWAALVLVAIPLEFGVRELTPLADDVALAYAATAVGLLCAGLLTSLGGYQLLAAVLGRRARTEAAAGSMTGPDEAPDASGDEELDAEAVEERDGLG